MTSAKVRMTVITRDDGTLVGTAMSGAGHGQRGGGIRARLVAGPGQKAQEIEIELSDKLLDGGDIDAVHARVRDHLGGRAKPGSKSR